MGKDTRDRLIELGPEALTDALIEVSVRDDIADELVNKQR